ncbi:hypothetical protein HPB50_012847 [Hyalomma asiaticum]|uniref:Uncharacterized protein n=1 Tax=Hyalomma asiaticum TaxID=266040 RepID=A0ACB7SLH4_HYAAI|nr:hypothetical protein HPB50_012847 [Hyalomma asiaticum]
MHSDELAPLIKQWSQGGRVSPSQDVTDLCKEVDEGRRQIHAECGAIKTAISRAEHLILEVLGASSEEKVLSKIWRSTSMTSIRLITTLTTCASIPKYVCMNGCFRVCSCCVILRNLEALNEEEKRSKEATVKLRLREPRWYQMREHRQRSDTPGVVDIFQGWKRRSGCPDARETGDAAAEGAALGRPWPCPVRETADSPSEVELAPALQQQEVPSAEDDVTAQVPSEVWEQHSRDLFVVPTSESLQLIADSMTLRDAQNEDPSLRNI